ncbi:MAG: flippase [Verrucomicrobiota bacterium]
MGIQLKSRLAKSASLRNLMWLFAEHGARLVSSLLIGVWVARYLGPEGFGYLNWILAGFSLVTICAKLGFENIFVRDVVRNPDESDRLVASAFTVRLLVALGIISISLLVVALFPGRTVGYMVLLSLGLLPGVSEVLTYRFQATQRGKLFTWCRLIQLGVSCLIRAGLILSEAGLGAFVCAIVLDELIMGSALLIVHKRQFGSWAGISPLPRMMFGLIRESFPLLLSSLSVILYMRMDQLMLGAMLDEAAVGVYSAGVRVVEGVYFVPMVMATAFFPAMLKAKAAGDAAYQKEMERLMTASVWVGIMATVTLWLGAGLAIGILFGDAYADAVPILRAQAFNVVFLAMGAVAGKWLYTEGLQVVHFGKTLVGLGINFALNMHWIPAHGGLGAAWAAVVSQGVAYFLVFAVIGSCRKIFWVQLTALSPIRAWNCLAEIRRSGL